VVTVTLRGDEVDLMVVDQGRGIPPDLLDSVMEWGTRGPASTGHGIGLSVADRLVASMGGRLRIRSDGETGTQATITLPAVLHAPAEGSR
jgi:signal transduction histidine kinase